MRFSAPARFRVPMNTRPRAFATAGVAYSASPSAWSAATALLPSMAAVDQRKVPALAPVAQTANASPFIELTNIVFCVSPVSVPTGLRF
jgi:hypothetical protein